jgi:hypothetical protein
MKKYKLILTEEINGVKRVYVKYLERYDNNDMLKDEINAK